MKKFASLLAVAFVMVLCLAVPAFAQPGQNGGPNPGGQWSLIDFSAAFGVGLTVVGAAYGISKLASSALESMARQPEVAGNIQTAMIIAAALIEGFTFYALFICSGL